MDLIFGTICSFHVKGKESTEPSKRLKKKHFMNTHTKKNRKENVYRKIQISK